MSNVPISRMRFELDAPAKVAVTASRPMKLAAAICALLLCACAHVPPYTLCHASEQRAIIDSLYFGTAMPGGSRVTPEQWQDFLAEVITPRFPDGLTAWAAAGQWKDRSGSLQREDSHVLHLVHDDTERADRAIAEIIAAYKARFHQEAVLRVRSPACSSF